MVKYIPHIIISIALLAIGYFARKKLHKCPTIIRTVEKIDTFYVGATPIVIDSKPINTPIAKPIYIHDTLEGKTDTFVKYVYQKNDKTFTSIDTAYYHSLFVSITDSGNCAGIQYRRFNWGGQVPIITKTITQTVTDPPQVFYFYAGVSNQFQKGKVIDVQPKAMLLFKQKFGVEYGYGVMSNTHNVGLNFKIK